MRKFLSLAVVAAGLVLAACSAPGGLSPREQSQQLMLGYLAIQTPALAAVKSPQLADKPQVKKAIAATTDAASAAVLAYDDQARKCVRDPATGKIVDAPGQNCDSNMLSRAWTAAQAAIAQAGQVLAAFGFKPGSAGSP